MCISELAYLELRLLQRHFGQLFANSELRFVGFEEFCLLGDLSFCFFEFLLHSVFLVFDIFYFLFHFIDHTLKIFLSHLSKLTFEFFILSRTLTIAFPQIV